MLRDLYSARPFATVGGMESKVPPIRDAARTPLVAELVAIIGVEREKIRQLEGHKKRLEAEP